MNKAADLFGIWLRILILFLEHVQ